MAKEILKKSGFWLKSEEFTIDASIHEWRVKWNIGSELGAYLRLVPVKLDDGNFDPHLSDGGSGEKVFSAHGTFFLRSGKGGAVLVEALW